MARKNAHIHADGAGVRCPKCGNGSRSRVVETRSHDGRVFRRRRCACGTRYSTVEQAMRDTIYGVVIKNKPVEIVP